ncbi:MULTISPECIES: glycosyltransferase [Roseobacteraceae]|uniref:glycosyltransferase n=1 Tax=Roseobacteraceae TaxID=2854170 RepID=UPI00125FC667|nr:MULTISPECIES: glycosyltransferase [Roseobacteraceae]KAB6717523.1 hypothetical protein C8029_03040 [Roseobacter sp. TSBP12]|tara:strand:+ start:5418 stop:6335 length:918 start_codon:yes stop_codon:yes gene_type:complete
MTFDDLDIAIFSYNRAAYLQNCVMSVQRHCPGARLTIFDDASTDPDTLAYLASLPEGMVVQPGSQDAAGRHGGLYYNMQRALDRADRTLLLTLQDDTQVVRSLDQSDWDTILSAFETDPQRAFLSVLFIKSVRETRYKRLLRPVPEQSLYDLRNDLSAQNHAKRMAYFDISLMHVDRLHAAHWQMQNSEAANVEQARRLFAPMPTMAHPFVFFCPEVPFFRNRGQSLAAKLALRVVGRDVKTLKDMTPAQIKAMKTRDMSTYPVAETFLEADNPKVRKPFVYKDVKARWWLSALHKIEQALKGRR